MDSMLLAEDVARKAIKKGSDSAEVFIKSTKGVSVDAKDGKVEALEASREFGIALKVINKQRLGFSFTTNPADIDRIVDEALAGAKWTEKDVCVDVADYMPSTEVTVFDEGIKNIKEDDIIKDAMLLEESALAFDRRIKRVRKANVSVGTDKTTILNSKGINISYDSSFIYASVSSLAMDNEGDGQMGWDFAVSRRMGDIDLNSIGSCASKRAVELLGSKRISAVKVPVVLDSSVAVEFLTILSTSLSAEAVQKKKSFLAGKVGKVVVSTLLDIIDDGTIPWGSGTKPVDDEGTPTFNKTLISKGELIGYIHNTYTAKKAGEVPTGNAVRGGTKRLPGVGVTNFYIKPNGDKGRNSMLKSLSRGILITEAMGGHTANPVSGDFSIGISGLWIEKGEVVYPIKEAVISGNILDLFKKVEEIGKDFRFYGNIGSPSLLIGEVDISA